MAKLTKRSAPVDIPKPLPQRGQEDEEQVQPGYTLCKGSDEPQSTTKSEPLLGWCRNCKSAANSWVDHLCYRCHKEAAGFVFDDEKKMWVKPPEKRRRRKSNGM